MFYKQAFTNSPSNFTVDLLLRNHHFQLLRQNMTSPVQLSVENGNGIRNTKETKSENKKNPVKRKQIDTSSKPEISHKRSKKDFGVKNKQDIEIPISQSQLENTNLLNSSENDVQKNVGN